MARRMIPRPGRTIDFKQWDGIPAIELQFTAAATSLGGSLQFAGPATILRARANIVCSLTGAAGAVSAQLVQVGLGIISTDAFTAGAAGVPDPGGEPEYPWLFWKSLYLDNLENATTGATEEGMKLAAGTRFEVDTKAMRKVKPGQALCWIVQTSVATDTNVYIGQTRVLIGT